jgi:hypothetical protein
LGVTNSKISHQLLEEQTVYSDDTSILLDKYLSLNQSTKTKIFKNSLDLVRLKHTYLNRICTLLKYL